MIFGPQYSHIQKILPIDPNQQDDQKEERKRKVRYQGRDWSEEEEEASYSVKQALSQQAPAVAKQRAASPAKMHNKEPSQLEKGQTLLKGLTTLEEKAAQLCFLVAEAIYDTEGQREIEKLIQVWQFGGILFTGGQFLRQGYLIKKYQEFAKTKLIFANEFTHALALYLNPKEALISEEDRFDREKEIGASQLELALKNLKGTKSPFHELGRQVMLMNRQLGVHLQFMSDSGNPLFLNVTDAKELRQGIREAGGIVGRHKKDFLQTHSSASIQVNQISFFANSEGQKTYLKHTIQETVNFKSLVFFDLTSSSSDEKILDAFEQQYDLFLVSKENLGEIIKTIARLVQSGKISEETLNRYLLKALTLKSMNKAAK